MSDPISHSSNAKESVVTMVPNIEPLPARDPTPEEIAVGAMLPFVAWAALLVILCLGSLRTFRAYKNLRSENVIRRLREARAVKESADRTALKLRYACSDFSHAAWSHNGNNDATFSSVDECIALIAELVHERLLEADIAHTIEHNRDRLTIAGGKLRTKTDESIRADYLDGQTNTIPSKAGYG